MDQLTPTERTLINSSLKNIRDTYFKTPISITKTGTGAVMPDRWNSGMTTKSGAIGGVVYNLKAMIEYVNPSTSFFMDTVGGADGDFQMLVTCGVEEAITEGAITSSRKCVISEGDSLTVSESGKKYRIVAVLFDGHYDNSGQLLMFKCTAETLN
jgi:hypothetical protein